MHFLKDFEDPLCIVNSSTFFLLCRFPAKILASTTLQHISLELNVLQLSTRIQIVTTSQAQREILFMLKALKQNPTTQHRKHWLFHTLITGDI